MTQATVFNEAALSMGMNPFDFPADSFPCDTCHNYAHYSHVVLVWEPGRRCFLCASCYKGEEAY